MLVYSSNGTQTYALISAILYELPSLIPTAVRVSPTFVPVRGLSHTKTPPLSMLLHSMFEFGLELVPTLIEVVPILTKH
jgi:hypothetical protein